jgi:antitoxin (DNA-binding transcriptional repressor) of toxin-antitoxin stability system
VQLRAARPEITSVELWSIRLAVVFWAVVFKTAEIQSEDLDKHRVVGVRRTLILTSLYVSLYNRKMKVTITEFRNNLFKLVEKVIAGESVEFVHQGTTIRLVVPEGSNSSKLDRLTPRQITNPEMSEKDHQVAQRRMQAEMLTEIEKDWAEI